ncbi:DUF4159 domain-containing protein [Alisedimentitalea sp. MJ-SS2]|uniref:DUF4159 domain-containing protein n=1 Tax=Aliisedimentitalea sp. MJ-SS2 TaxID=3049795 RepID=UPI0029114E0A|nr:DUF4159 domain-containing protein [Alisedimentitalea sp. MJ-SS2]MDU8929623.1 DUF4159 domain-containing protein [Alisedimentitalea sp. MJ-SS2]
MTLGPIAFTTPWLLGVLIALPLLWLLLRAIPPAPIKRIFPAVVLLLGLRDDDSISDRTPWWLLLLRMLAVAALIIGLAGPVLNPAERRAPSTDPLLIVMDASWASARNWDDRLAMLDSILAEAGRNARPVALSRLTQPEVPQFQSAADWRKRLAGLNPAAWTPTDAMMQGFAGMLPTDNRFETLWMSDGLAHEGRDTLLRSLESHGAVSVVQALTPVVALEPMRFADGTVQITVRRDQTATPQDITVQAHGRDPTGTIRVLAELPLTFPSGADAIEGNLTLQAELRGRLTSATIKGHDSAGAVALTDDSLRRREVALISGRENREGLELLSPLHYLRQALAPNADLLEGQIEEVLPANPDAVVLADIATLSPTEEKALSEWIDKGGLLLRFAGPRLAASEISRRDEHPLMPVRLRVGGRSVGGAMSWGAPKSLAPFDKDSPFFGLPVPVDVRVTAQVMAQPDPTLASRVIATLSDGTPMVTRKRIGLGQVVLFHVTANAEWSSLPLSGLYMSMLERLSVATAITTPSIEEMAGTVWQPLRILDGFGTLVQGDDLPGVSGEELSQAPLGPTLLPGLYASDDRQIARNTLRPGDALTTAVWPTRIPQIGFTTAKETQLGGWLLALALGLITLDILASLVLTGRLTAPRAASAAGCLITLLMLPTDGQTNDVRAVDATAEVTLAHVLTGNKLIDDTARAGLFGLSETLFFRTSVEPSEPMSINLETDELAFFPLLYWPITLDQQRPSEAAYDKLNRYLRGGGMILFDTRDGDIAGFGASSPNGRKLQQLAAPLDIPALEPVPGDHVLTRTFYLLREFPGRHSGRDVWVEAAPPDAEKIEGMPFRNLNDNVTPVIIGGNDWAAAWAMDRRGQPIFPVGRGLGGERQRELAYRFGVNLVMHVLTGNYKSDQVHVPALLERLGQ